ncbi:hypothetical protein [Planktotalea sp.]|uniref:hypothetical protein n=1 Tax=Planktotalea sp. TaxID=2029877 RepID=UPI003D6BB8E0
MASEGTHLDPENWDDFGRDMHALLDHCLERMKNARDLPWRPKPEDMGSRMSLRAGTNGVGSERAMQHLVQDIMPFATGNTLQGSLAGFTARACLSRWGQSWSQQR